MQNYSNFDLKCEPRQLTGPANYGDRFEKRAPDREIPLKFPSVLLPGLRIGVFWYWELAASSSGIQKEMNEMPEQSYKIK